MKITITRKITIDLFFQSSDFIEIKKCDFALTGSSDLHSVQQLELQTEEQAGGLIYILPILLEHN